MDLNAGGAPGIDWATILPVLQALGVDVTSLLQPGALASLSALAAFGSQQGATEVAGGASVSAAAILSGLTSPASAGVGGAGGLALAAAAGLGGVGMTVPGAKASTGEGCLAGGLSGGLAGGLVGGLAMSGLEGLVMPGNAAGGTGRVVMPLGISGGLLDDPRGGGLGVAQVLGGLPGAAAGTGRVVPPNGMGTNMLGGLPGGGMALVAATSAAPPQPDVDLSTLENAEVEWWETRGFGFVRTQGGTRAYVHNSAFGGGDLFLGERVKCSVNPDPRDPTKFKAPIVVRHKPPLKPGEQERAEGWLQHQVSSTALPGSVYGAGLPGSTERMGAELQQGQGEWAAGTVAEWNDGRGFGFVSLEDGRRAYVHHSVFGGGSLTAGHACHVVLLPDRVNVGKWMVAAIQGDEQLIQPKAEGHFAKRQRLT